MNTGCRIVYDESATAYEETPSNLEAEFRRRTRIGAGDYQSLGMLWPLMNPFEGWTSFTFISHKVLRWLCPFFLLGVSAANLFLVRQGGLFIYAPLVQIALYSIALLGHFLSHRSIVGRVMRLATMFTAMNAALLVGFFRWATARQQAAWERTAR